MAFVWHTIGINIHTQPMKRSLLFSGAITAILVGIFSLAYFTAAASTKFPFSGRGIVTANNTLQKTVSVHFTHLNSLARDLGLGKVVEVSLSQTKIFRVGAAGVQQRVTPGKIAVGDEVSVNGRVRTDDAFIANKVVIRNRSFIIMGTLNTYDYANRQMKVDVTTSSYKPNDLKNQRVTIDFTQNALQTFDGKTVIEPSDLAARDQNVRVEGYVINSDEFQATKITENFPS